jgi:long-chain acyl-CoA synthetase
MDASKPKKFSYANQQTLLDLFFESCAKFGPRPAFRCYGTVLTYTDIALQSKRFAYFLQHDCGLKPGDRAAIMLPNILQYPIVLFGMMQAGVVVVNVNPLHQPPELLHELKDSGAKVMVVLSQFASKVAEVIDHTEVQKVVVTEIGDCFPTMKRCAVYALVHWWKHSVPRWHLPSWVSFRSLMNHEIGAVVQPQLRPHDVAFIQYTSGTTAKAKGVMLSHGNLVANIAQAEAVIATGLKHESEIIITALPLYHVFSLMANCCLFFKLGGENILIPNARDIGSLIRVMKKTPFTAFTGVNTLFHALLDHRGFRQCSFKELTITVGGGMAVQEAVAKRWQKVTGCVLTQAYGMTEASPAIAMNSVQAKTYSLSVGQAVPGTEISIRNDRGVVLAPGKSGEVWVKGPQVMLGYWQQVEESKKALAHGYLHTGDVGYLDSENALVLVDRMKDLIIVSGFNVAAVEVESVLLLYKNIQDVAVVGLPDEKQGQVIVACLITAKKINLKQLVQHCSKYCAPYKVPRHFVTLKELPKNSLGKVKKAQLRELLLQQKKKPNHVSYTTRKQTFDLIELLKG